MCDCIQKIKKALEDRFGAENFEIQLSQWLDLEKGVTVTDLPPLMVKFRKKLDNGKSEKRFSKTHIPFNHCPFCGVARFTKEQEAAK